MDTAQLKSTLGRQEGVTTILTEVGVARTGTNPTKMISLIAISLPSLKIQKLCYLKKRPLKFDF